MGNWISFEEVNRYLIRIKNAIAEDRFSFEGDRIKNRNSLSRAGIFAKHVKDQILLITYLDYFNGPEEEKDKHFPPGEVLFFGCNINNHEFFIKLKLFEEDDGESCVCISFHIAEKPIIYPYKKGK